MKRIILTGCLASVLAHTTMAQTKIYDFSFDNTLSTSVGSGTFSGGGATYTTDRHGNVNSAVTLNSAATANLSNLPIGSSSRAISIWLRKSNGPSTASNLARYGTFDGAGVFGFYMTSNSQLRFQTGAGDAAIPSTVPNNEWTHVVLNYETNGTLSIYVNNEQVESIEPTLNTLNGSFQLGESNFSVSFDDFKIYDGSLSVQQVNDLYYYDDLEPAQPSMLYHFDFNNSFDATVGIGAFEFNTSDEIETPFTEDRFGIENNAINIQNIGAIATLSGLPYGNSERTVSVWAKFEQLRSDYNFVYSYGITSSGTDGLYVKPNNIYHFFPVNAASLEHEVGVWYHFTTTFDGVESKIYRNGQLISTLAMDKNTLNNNDIFSIGMTELGWNNYFKGAIDELSIYNYALSENEITDMFVSAATFSVETLLVYPNPASTVLNIKNIATDTNIIITDVAGRVVYTSTASNDLITISTENWSNGLYLIQTALNGTVQQQKLMVQK